MTFGARYAGGCRWPLVDLSFSSALFLRENTNRKCGSSHPFLFGRAPTEKEEALKENVGLEARSAGQVRLRTVALARPAHRHWLAERPSITEACKRFGEFLLLLLIGAARFVGAHRSNEFAKF